MKKIIITLLLIGNSVLLYSQLLNQNIYEFDENVHVGQMILTSDSNLIIPAYYNYGLHLLKTNLEGDIIWEKDYEFPENFSFSQITETPTKYFFIGGSYSYPDRTFLMKLNSTGDSLFTILGYQNENTNFDYSSTLSLPDGNLFITGMVYSVYYPNPPALTGYISDTLGNKSDIFSAGSFLNSKPYIFDSKIICNIDNFSGNFLTIIFKYSLIDQSESWTYFEFDNSDVVIDSYNNYYFSLYGNTTSQYKDYDFAKANEQGDIVWLKSFDTTTSALTRITTKLEIIDNTVLFCGYFKKSGVYYGGDLYVGSINLNGQLKYLYTNNDFYSQNPISIATVGDKLFVSGEIVASEGENTNAFLNIYSLDSLTTSVKENLTSFTDDIAVYPNPATTQITIRLPDYTAEHHGNMQLSCFNIYGEEIYKEKINRDQDKSFVDVGSWQKGMYFGVVYSNGEVVGKCKFVVKPL